MNALLAYLNRLIVDAGWVELRHQTGSGWITTWHRHPDTLLAEAHRRSSVGNLYTSLNRISEPMRRPIRNEDVDRYCRLLFDFDPVRQVGVSSTDDEIAEATARADLLAHHLSAHDWPVPAKAMSGNGAHLQYRVALPNTAEVREQLATVYAGLHRIFDDDAVSFDRSVRNPGRICGLYGSTKRKGASTPERPYRQSWIRMPQDWYPVTQNQIEALANAYAVEPRSRPQDAQGTQERPAQPRGRGAYVSLDVVAWFRTHNTYIGHIEGNKHAVRCPWSEEHSTPSPVSGSDTIIFEANNKGWPGFYCHHSHCEARRILDVIEFWGDADAFCTRAF